MSAVRLFTVISAMALVAVFAGCATGRARAADGQAAVQPAGTANDALRQWVQSRGRAYAGDCSDTRSPDDVGKVCSRWAADRGTVSAYLAGRTFSEFDSWVFLTHTSGGWCVAATARVDITADDSAVPWPSLSAAPPSTCSAVVALPAG